jgi:hypothetical protein
VTHYSRLNKIVIDAPGDVHDQELTFWQGAMGQEFAHNERHPEYHGTDLHGHDLVMLVQRIGGGLSRMHVDIHTDDLDAEVARLEALGAKRQFQAHSWWVMSDPAGLLFCVVPDDRGRFTDENAQRWD